MTTNDQLLTVPDLAARLGISTEGVRRRIASGQIRAIKLGLHNSALRVASEDLHKYLDDHVVTTHEWHSNRHGFVVMIPTPNQNRASIDKIQSRGLRDNLDTRTFVALVFPFVDQEAFRKQLAERGLDGLWGDPAAWYAAGPGNPTSHETRDRPR